MNFNQLNCFITVAQYRNFTKASRTLHIVQSAVSHNIAELEKELGVKLFIRDHKSVTLTPAGQALLNDAFHILSSANEFANNARNLSTGISGELKVGYVFAPIAERMLSHLKTFQNENPRIHVAYNSYDNITISRMLETHKLDIGFARYVTLLNKSVLNWHTLYKEPMCIVVNKDHPLHQEESVTMQQFSQTPLVIMGRKYNPGMYDMSMSLYQKEGLTPFIVDTPHDVLTVMMMVKLGRYITILPECWKPIAGDGLCFLKIRDACHEVGIAWNKYSENSCVYNFLKYMGIPAKNES
ncbi:MAG: LysR family transcriptional regulator [Eubacterium sp.]|jgi:Transcriptional regulator|nr:LysR family transcriptional regulator [Eubacterium sp.]